MPIELTLCIHASGPPTISLCGAVKARKGNALLFFSMKPDGSFDGASLHSGCPVLRGEKWSATKWIHSG